MNAITIPNALPPTIVALTSETLAQVAALVDQARAVTTIDTVEQMRQADDLVAAASKLDRAIEAERKRLKAPILELAQALDEASSEARTPLIGIKSDLGRLILAFQQAENARREAERKRQEELRREAERLEAERRAAEAAAREAARLAEEERRKAAADVAPWDEPAPEPGPPAPWDEPEPEPAPVHVPTVLPPEQQMDMAPIKSRSVTTRAVPRLVIEDLALVPREVAGIQLWKFDEAAALRALKLGAKIPGLSLTADTTVAAKGR